MIESRKHLRMEEEDDDFEFLLLVVNFIIVVIAKSYQRHKVRELAWNEYERTQKRTMWLDTLRNNTKCQEQLRFDRRFEKLCRVLRSKGGLVTSRNVTDEEVVAFFLHIFAHNLKNRTIQALFARSGETANPSAAAYSNKSIEHWDDICALVGPDRAVGDGVEHHEEGATMMDEEACDGASSSMDTTSTSSNKKRKRDNLAEAVTSVAHTLKSYVEARLKATPPTLGGKEVYDEVSNVIGILRPEVLKAVSMFIESPVKFQVLKDLPDDQKLDWIILCLDERSRGL